MDVKIIVPTLPTHGYATVYVYPTISPHIVVIPIVCCIIGFPVIVLMIICALRSRARKARMKAKRRRPLDHTITELVPHTTFNQSRYFNERVIRTKDGKRKTIVRFKPMPELDLDTVVEEKSEFDAECNVNELLSTQREISRRIENHSASFRSYRYGYGASGQPLPMSTPTPLGRSSIVATETKPVVRPTLTTDLDKVDEEEEDHEVAATPIVAAEENQEVEAQPSEVALKFHNVKSPEIPESAFIALQDSSFLERETSSSNVDPGTFSPTSHSGSRTSLRESSTTISSKDFEYFYPNYTSAANLLSISSPIKCHMVDIGGVKCTPNYITIKGKAIEHIALDYIPSSFTNKHELLSRKLSRSCEEFKSDNNPNVRDAVKENIHLSSPLSKESNLKMPFSSDQYSTVLSPKMDLSDKYYREFSSRIHFSDQSRKQFNPKLQKRDQSRREFNPKLQLNDYYCREFNARIPYCNPYTKEYTISRKFKQNIPEIHDVKEYQTKKSFSRSDESLVTAIIRKYEGFATNDHNAPIKYFHPHKT